MANLIIIFSIICIVVIVISIVLFMFLNNRRQNILIDISIALDNEANRLETNGINTIDKQDFMLQKTELAYFRADIILFRTRLLSQGPKIDVYYQGMAVISHKALVIYPDSKPRRLLFKNMGANFWLTKKLIGSQEFCFTYNNWTMSVSTDYNQSIRFIKTLFFVKNNLSKSVAKNDDLSF